MHILDILSTIPLAPLAIPLTPNVYNRPHPQQPISNSRSAHRSSPYHHVKASAPIKFLPRNMINYFDVEKQIKLAHCAGIKGPTLDTENEEKDDYIDMKIIEFRATKQKPNSSTAEVGGRQLLIQLPKNEISLTAIIKTLEKSYPEFSNYSVFTKNGLEIESNSVTESFGYWEKTLSRKIELLYMPRRGVSNEKKQNLFKILNEIFESVKDDIRLIILKNKILFDH